MNVKSPACKYNINYEYLPLIEVVGTFLHKDIPWCKIARKVQKTKPRELRWNIQMLREICSPFETGVECHEQKLPRIESFAGLSCVASTKYTFDILVPTQPSCSRNTWKSVQKCCKGQKMLHDHLEPIVLPAKHSLVRYHDVQRVEMRRGWISSSQQNKTKRMTRNQILFDLYWKTLQAYYHLCL